MLQFPDMIACLRRDARLTVAGCSRNWLAANDGGRPPPWDSRHICIACAQGARFNGREAPLQAAEIIRPICPRCLRVSDRLINDYLCVSCYNRSAECRRGANARGSRPRLLGLLHSQIVVASTGFGPPVPIRMEGVTGLSEIIVQTAKHARLPMAFGRPTVIIVQAKRQIDFPIVLPVMRRPSVVRPGVRH